MNEKDTTFRFFINAEPWDLHSGRARRDIARHDQRVRETLRGNLSDIVSNEDIVTSDGQKIIRVPIRGLELPRFRFDPYDEKHYGQGNEGTKDNGQTQPGTILGKTGEGSGNQAGHEPGTDVYEAEFTVDDILEMMFEDLALPDIEERGRDQLVKSSLEYTTVRKTGPWANLDSRRTLIEAYKRNAKMGKPGWDIDETQDLRFKSWEEKLDPQTNAVIFAMRDVSGSMGDHEAYLARTFFTWMVRFLRKQYSGVDIAFITCHTEAQEVDEQTFFHLSGSGGTRMGSAYQKALEIIDNRYNPSSWNIYPYLFSDGYNWDDEACVLLVKKLLDVSNQVGYGEVNHYGHWDGDHSFGQDGQSWAPLGALYDRTFRSDERFVMSQFGAKEDVWPGLKQFLRKRHEVLATA